MIKTYSISTHFESEANACSIWLTNIYGPNADGERPDFFLEISQLAEQIQGSWLLVRDFNCIRTPLECTSLKMAPSESVFNSLIWDLSIQEIPLQDWTFTWSNMQPPPPCLSTTAGMTFSLTPRPFIWVELPQTTFQSKSLLPPISHTPRFSGIVTTGSLNQASKIW
jgi:hypothetical protein